MSDQLDQLCINTVRFLSVDAVFHKPVSGISRVPLHRFSLGVIRAADDSSIASSEIRWLQGSNCDG